MTDQTSHRGVIAILSACNFVIGMGAFLIVGLVEPLAEGLGAPVTAVGGLLTVYAIAFALSSPVLVALTGRIGRRRIIAAGLAVFTVATLACAVAPSLAVLYPLRIIAAAGAGLVTPVTLAVAAALAPEEGRGKALSAVFFGLTLAQVLGLPAGSWIAYTFGWREAFAVPVLLALPCLWLVWTRVPAGLRFDPVSLSDLGGVLRDGVAMMTIAFTAGFLGAIYVLYAYLAPLLSQTMGFGRDGIALALLLFGAGAPIGTLIGGRLTDRLGAVGLLTIVCLCQIAMLPVFSALPLPVGWLFAAIFAWSVVGWAFAPAQQVRLVDLAPRLAPVLLSLNAAAIYIGIALGSALGGLVIGAAGIAWLGLAGGITALGALGLLLWSHRAANLRAALG